MQGVQEKSMTAAASKLAQSELVFTFAGDEAALQAAFDALRESPVIGIDTETGGFVPQKYPMWSVQFSNGEYSVLVPYNLLGTLGPLEQILTSDKWLKVAHNAKFDLKFLRHNGINPVRVFDTMLAEKLLGAGKEFKQASLKALAQKYLGLKMSKDEREDFYNGSFARENKLNPRTAWRPELIDYALDDVWVLIEIQAFQHALLQEQGMTDVAGLEMSLVPVVARMEYLGVALDVTKTEQFGDRMQRRADAMRAELHIALQALWEKYWRPLYAVEMRDWLAWEAPYKRARAEGSAKHFEIVWRANEGAVFKQALVGISGEQAINIRAERDKLFKTKKQEHLEIHKLLVQALREQKPLSAPPKTRREINITSNQQLKESLAQTGLFLPNMRKITLEDAVGQNETLDLILEFRKYEKLAKYRTVILEELNDVTGRIHPDINQIVSTGRFSVSSPPLQQIPAKGDEGKELRSCFIAPAGRRLVSADYAAIELVIIGALSKDKGLLEAIRRQKDPAFDLHTWTMSKFLGTSYDSLIIIKGGGFTATVAEARKRFESEVKIPELLEIESLPEWFKRLRDILKTITYGIAYGLSEYGLSLKFHMSKENAALIIGRFYGAYPGVRDFIADAGEKGIRLGYSQTMLGRRRYYSVPRVPTQVDVIEAIREDLEEEGEGRAIAELTREEREKLSSKKKWAMERERQWIMASIRRRAANMPIQGMSADITKEAMVLYSERTAHFPYEDFLRLTVHDELVAEVGVERADEASAILESSMIDAAYLYLPTDIPVKAESKINTHWEK